MTKETKIAAQRWAAILLTAILIPLASYAFTKYDASLMKVPRFVTDSSVFMAEDAAFKRDVRDALQSLKVGQDSINLRLRQIQCGSRINEGCR